MMLLCNIISLYLVGTIEGRWKKKLKLNDANTIISSGSYVIVSLNQP